MCSTINLGTPFCLDRSVLNITSRCTLKCKLCVTGCPFYDVPPHYDLETCKKSIVRFFEIVDYVRWYELSGGEPFIHKQLPQIIEEVMQFKSKFDKLLIITNGTLMPSEELENVLVRHRDKLYFMISHYGDISVCADDLEDYFKERSIEVKVKKYYGDDQHFGGWVDYGECKNYNRSEDELNSVFSRCGATKMNGNLTTHNGKIHWCVPSAKNMTILKKIPDVESDYIDLFNDELSVAEQREKIRNLYQKKYISACKYCSGGFGNENAKRYPAAEQLW